MQRIVKAGRETIKQYISTNVLFITFVLTSLLNASLLRFLTIGNFFSVRPVIADLACILIIGSFGYLLKEKKQIKYYLITSFIFVLIFFANSLYYTNYMSFASFSLLTTSLQVADVGGDIVGDVLNWKDFVFVWQIIALYAVHLILKKKNYYELAGKQIKRTRRIAQTFVAGIIVIGLFLTSITAIDLGRFAKIWNREYVVMKFGIISYQVSDIFTSIRPQISPLFGFDKNAKIFTDYYNKKDKQKQTNEYTDIFKGKNIITIHAESIQTNTINTKIAGREITPNLNKLVSEGLYFSNFYSQYSTGTSSDAEFTFSTSLMPSLNGTVAMNYWNREYVTIQKLLKNNSYHTFSMHGNNGTFWNRISFHESLGYDRFYHSSQDFEIDEVIGLGLSDKSFFSQAVPKIKEINKNNQNFYGNLIMLTNHMPFLDLQKQGKATLDLTYPYTITNPRTGEKENRVSPYLEGTKIGNYFQSVHYADEAIGELIQKLDQEGLLEDTVIVIYGDHDAKIKKEDYEYYYNYDPYSDIVLPREHPAYEEIDFYDYEQLRKVPFIIWSKDNVQPKEVTKVMGMIDVLPTLGNMFGFQSDYALGNDIFSTKENVVVFPDGDWVTDKMYYNNQKQEGKVLKEKEIVSQEYIQKHVDYAEEILTISSTIITYDMIAKTNQKNQMKQELEG